MKHSRQRIRAGAISACLALAAGLCMPTAAQEATADTAPETALETAAAAVARLDFTAALSALGKAIEDDPTAPAPRLARSALHIRMQRPALALADLDAVLAADPAHLPALRARAEIWDDQRAWSRARADLDAALAVAPGDPEALEMRAQVNERAGMFDAALADYDAALAAAPDNPDLARARAALAASRAEREAARVLFAPEAVMSEDFLVTAGNEAAPNTLYVVDAATDLAPGDTGLDPARLDRLIDTGVLRVVRLFTYTGREASIWGNLALICAGAQGFDAAHAALSDATGRAALEATEAGDFEPLERLLRAAYSVAGIDQELVQSCALDRLHATRYLADWQAHRDAAAWRGVNLLDHWPAWVWNGTAVGPQTLAARLAEIDPAPDAAADPTDGADEADAGAVEEPDAVAAAQVAAAPDADTTEGPDSAPAGPDNVDGGDPARTPNPAAGDAAPGPPSGTAEAGAPGDQAADTPPAADQPPAVPPGADPGTEDGADPAPVRFPTRPEPADDARVPVDLRGIYAPSLAACLGYLETIEAPERIDAVLPQMNPLDGPVLGTVLVTSRRVYLFNPLDTECAIASADAGANAAGGWHGRFACASPLSPGEGPGLELAPAPADGTAPRLLATFAGGTPITLRQCRTLGQLGKAFASLWSHDGAGCTVAVPLARGPFTFSIDRTGNLVLRVAPSTIPAGAGKTQLHAVIDGAALPAIPGRWDGTGWQMSLGPFAAAADRLGWGMFLDVRATGDTFEARLPLFGSSAAMDGLAACAPAVE